MCLCQEPKYQKYIENTTQWSLDMNLSSSVRNSAQRILFLSDVPFLHRHKLGSASRLQKQISTGNYVIDILKDITLEKLWREGCAKYKKSSKGRLH